MERIKGLQDLRRFQRPGGEDKVYFEMYKLVSERLRLTKVRSALMNRIELIDHRLGEITIAFNLLEPKNRDRPAHHLGINPGEREGGEHDGSGRLAERFRRFSGIDPESGSTGR